MNGLDAERDRATPAWVDADELRFSHLSLHSAVLGGRHRELWTLQEANQEHHDFDSFFLLLWAPLCPMTGSLFVCVCVLVVCVHILYVINLSSRTSREVLGQSRVEYSGIL